MQSHLLGRFFPPRGGESDTDLEMRAIGTNDTTASARQRLSEAIFGTTCHAGQDWPGVDAYLGFVQRQFEDCRHQACFTPLWEILQFPLPPRDAELFVLAVLVHRSLIDPDILHTIDGIVQSVLSSSSRQLISLDVAAQNSCRQVVFKAISWVTTLFETTESTSGSRLEIHVPDGAMSLRRSLPMDMSRRPISRLILELGPLLRGPDKVLATAQHDLVSLLYVSSLNVASLQRVSKINIEWTNSLGCHLMFDPLKRLLLLYRFPTFCALSLAPGSLDR